MSDLVNLTTIKFYVTKYRELVPAIDAMNKLFALLLFISFTANSQCKVWKWPDNKSMAQEKVALLQDAVVGKNFSQARAPLHWLLVNAPALHSSIYIHGVTVYEGMIETAASPDLRQLYLDSVLTLYDIRATVCDDQKNSSNRKALALFRYAINDSKPDAILNLMDEAFRICKNDIIDATLVPYMETIVVCQQRGNKMSQAEILSRYEALSLVLDHKLRQSSNDPSRKARLVTYQQQIDQLSYKVIDITCDYIQSTLKPKFLHDPQDPGLAKLLLSKLLQAKCPVDQVWLMAAEVICKNEPDFGLAKTIGIEYYAKDEIEKARNYFALSLTLAPTRADSSDVYVLKGSLWAKSKDLSQARDAFREALRLQPTRTDALIKIGDLYYNSSESCSRKVHEADDRLIYLIAYDYYAKAGDLAKMESAQKVFPSVEEIFLLNYHVGQRMKVGCWINEFTILRTRD